MASNRQAIAAFVDSLPENGEWWTSSGRTTFIKIITRLMTEFGLSLNAAKEIAEALYHATAGEFGN
jgi:hypothetical protein